MRTYGHIVVDEAQDLSPMQLRMLTRRSLNGSMTVVGDIAQSTGAWAHADWEEVLDQLPDRRPARRTELTIGYRLPGPNMVLAAKVLALAAPDLTPPSSVRQDGDEPRFVEAGPGRPGGRRGRGSRSSSGTRSTRAAWPSSSPTRCSVRWRRPSRPRASSSDGRPATASTARSRSCPSSLVKGLELDASVVVEPAAILEEEVQGARALYVALTRATKRLVLVHERPLPEVLR